MIESYRNPALWSERSQEMRILLDPTVPLGQLVRFQTVSNADARPWFEASSVLLTYLQLVPDWSGWPPPIVAINPKDVLRVVNAAWQWWPSSDAKLRGTSDWLRKTLSYFYQEHLKHCDCWDVPETDR